MTDTQLSTTTRRPIDVIKSYMLSPDVRMRFEEMMGKGASYYLNQVMLVVANSEKLQKCTPQSIFTAAMRAATLRLSVDPGQGQAWIIPYAGVATFQMGYRGLYELALRTNLYRFINVLEIYEGETIVENRMTGIQGLTGHRKEDGQVWAYMLYFKLTNGYEKTFTMTVEEIEAHARTYAPKAYADPDSAWNKNNGRERSKMMKKTVLSNGLRKWGRFNAGDLEIINEIEEEQGWNSPESAPLDPDLAGDGKKEPEKEPTLTKATTDEIRANWPADASMSYETAETIKSRDAVAYVSFAAEELEVIYGNIVAEIKKNGLSPDERAQLEMKRDAALLIQNAIIKATTPQ